MAYFYALEDNSYQYLDNGDYSISVSKELQEAVKEGPPEELEELQPEQYPDAMYEADSFRGSQLSSWAQILYDPQVTEDGCYFSFRTVSSENSEDVLFGVAFWEGNTTDLCDGRYIFLTGTIIGEYTTLTAMAMRITVLLYTPKNWSFPAMRRSSLLLCSPFLPIFPQFLGRMYHEAGARRICPDRDPFLSDGG